MSLLRKCFVLLAGCVFASMPKTARGQFTVLGGDPKGENVLYANGNNIFIRDINVSWIWCIENAQKVN